MKYTRTLIENNLGKHKWIFEFYLHYKIIETVIELVDVLI